MTLNKVNYLNIGLMIAALIAAFALPFEVFLISYAILGPAHYLTEISWLHDRQYFSPRKVDVLPLLMLTLILLAGSRFWADYLHTGFIADYFNDMVFITFGLALVMILTRNWWIRLAGAVALAGAAWLLHDTSFMFRAFGVYLPTLLHVYIFTGAFILYGSLKSKSTSGYISFLVFLLCPVLCFVLFTDTSSYQPSEWVYEKYISSFADLNIQFNQDILGHSIFNYDWIRENASPEFYERTQMYPNYIFTYYRQMFPDSVIPASFFDPQVVSASMLPAASRNPFSMLAVNPMYVMAGRFIAFAYVYHYLNWFSKTSVIRWHDIPKLRFIGVVAVWVASMGIYFYDYTLGLQWLFLLSFAHVVLEFPLNHQSFIGIGRELYARIAGKGTG